MTEATHVETIKKAFNSVRVISEEILLQILDILLQKIVISTNNLRCTFW